MDFAHMALFTLLARPASPLAFRPHPSDVIRHEPEHSSSTGAITQDNAPRFDGIVSKLVI